MISVAAPDPAAVGKLVAFVLERDPTAEVKVQRNQSVYSVKYPLREGHEKALSPEAITDAFGETGYEEAMLAVGQSEGVRIKRLWLPNARTGGNMYDYADRIASAVYKDYRGEEAGEMAWIVSTEEINITPIRINNDCQIV